MEMMRRFLRPIVSDYFEAIGDVNMLVMTYIDITYPISDMLIPKVLL